MCSVIDFPGPKGRPSKTKSGSTTLSPEDVFPDFMSVPPAANTPGRPPRDFPRSVGDPLMGAGPVPGIASEES